jgi:peptidoglycan/LPS O-acetylase OafA/YrhL
MAFIMKKASASGFQTDINGLRGLSVLVVVLYHFNLRLFSGGFVGVDVFFVISGYLMTKIIVSGFLKNNFDYFQFVLRRAQRIFPALYVLLLVLLIGGMLLLAPTDLARLATQTVQAVIFNSNNYFAGKQGYFSGGVDDNWLMHTWSLSVEWQFYMLYPVLIWLAFAVNGLRSPDRRDLRLFYVTLAALFAASLAWCVTQDSQSAFFSVAARSWQMIAGGMVYLAIARRPAPFRFGAACSYAGLAIMLASMYVVSHYGLEAVWPGYFALLPVAGACLLLFGGYEHNLVLSNPVVQKLGSWSYSIYLWHMPVVIALSITGLMIGEPKLAKVGGVLLSIVLGYISFKLIEPAGYLKKWSLPKNVAGCTAAVLVVAAMVMVRTHGLVDKTSHPQAFLNIEAAENSSTYPDRCENKDLGNDKFCLINESVPGKKLLVIGDSHAGHLYPWFAAHSTLNTTFFVKSGCPVIPGFERVGPARGCADFSAKAFARAGSGEFDSVIISMNWAGFTKLAEGICWRDAKGCVPPTALANPSLPLDQVRAAIQTLLDKGVKVSVVDGTPWFMTSAPRQIARDLFWSNHSDYSIPLQSMLDQTRDYDAMFQTLQQRPGFTVLSLRPALCPQGKCVAYDATANVPIYKDRDHINPFWIVGHGDVFAAKAGVGSAGGQSVGVQAANVQTAGGNASRQSR